MTAPMRKVIRFEPLDEERSTIRLECGHDAGTIRTVLLTSDNRPMFDRAGIVPHKRPCFQCVADDDESGRVQP